MFICKKNTLIWKKVFYYVQKMSTTPDSAYVHCFPHMWYDQVKNLFIDAKNSYLRIFQFF
jgi:hypothetical protein